MSCAARCRSVRVCLAYPPPPPFRGSAPDHEASRAAIAVSTVLWRTCRTKHRFAGGQEEGEKGGMMQLQDVDLACLRLGAWKATD